MELFLTLIYVSSFFGIFSSLVYLLTLNENKHMLSNPKPKKLLKTTVIVPAFNEQGRIEKTVKSFLNLNYPKELLELVLVDDGSKDNTWKEMQQLQRLDPKRIHVLHKTNGGKASALNLGIKKAKGEIIVSLDADSFVDRNALKRMIGYFNNPNVMAVTPSMKIWKPTSWLQKVQFAEYMFGVFLRKAASFLNCIHVTPGPFSAYRKSFFEKHGGYEEGNPTEDMEIALRIQSNNYIIENAVDAYSYTLGPSRFMPLFNQRVRWYSGFLTNIWRYKHFFSRKYGTFGLFYLPAAFISVIFPILLISYMLKKYAGDIFSGLNNLYSINFDFMKILSFKIDSFYFVPGTLSILTILSLALMMFLIFIGRRLSEDKERITLPFALMMLIYGPFYALWWVSAFIHRVRGKDVKWSGVVWKKD